MVTKETFYSGHNGTTEFEVYLLIGSYPSSLLMLSLLHMSFKIPSYPGKIWSSFILDFLLLVSPVILAYTLLSNHVLMLLTLQIVTSSVLTLALTRRDPNLLSTLHINTFKHRVVDIFRHRHFLTHFRVFTNIATVICILAVDFQVFPRRFAKTETFGRGLMDLGVGLFMIGNALVSPESRGKTPASHGKRTSALMNVTHTVTSCSPLLILGLMRVFFISRANYHEHVSEYGAHWNFFFTLAAVRILVTIIFTVVPVSLSGFLAIVLSMLYQHLLNSHGLKEYVLNGSDGQGSRNGILEANREGIYSCIGYTAIYLAGVSIGRFLFQKRSTIADWIACFFTMVLCNGALFFVSWVICPGPDAVSRRLANLPYVVWVVTSCLSSLIVLLSLEMFLLFISSEQPLTKSAPGMMPRLPYGPSRTPLRSTRGNRILKEGNDTKHQPLPLIVAAISKNQLLNFLLANLLTGIVNMSIDTLSATPIAGFSIVATYSFALCLTMVTLYDNNINTKVW